MTIQTTAQASTWATCRTMRPVRALIRWWRERRTVMALDALDDETPKDPGICRCEIPSIARSTWTDPGRW
jgi:uncharacterized protein YjiS (DUF1127 family)